VMEERRGEKTAALSTMPTETCGGKRQTRGRDAKRRMEVNWEILGGDLGRRSRQKTQGREGRKGNRDHSNAAHGVLM